MTSPWGYSESVTRVADGVEFHETASHGGYRLSAERRAKVEAMFPERRGQPFYFGGEWFEEDCEWAYVAKAFPELFPSEAQPEADAMLRWLAERHANRFDDAKLYP